MINNKFRRISFISSAIQSISFRMFYRRFGIPMDLVQPHCVNASTNNLFGYQIWQWESTRNDFRIFRRFRQQFFLEIRHLRQKIYHNLSEITHEQKFISQPYHLFNTKYHNIFVR